MPRFLCSGIRNHGVQHELCALRGDRGERICPTEAAGRPFREEIQTTVFSINNSWWWWGGSDVSWRVLTVWMMDFYTQLIEWLPIDCLIGRLAVDLLLFSRCCLLLGLLKWLLIYCGLNFDWLLIDFRFFLLAFDWLAVVWWANDCWSGSDWFCLSSIDLLVIPWDTLICSVADPRSRIRFFPSRIQDQKDPGFASKNLRIFNTKSCL